MKSMRSLHPVIYHCGHEVNMFAWLIEPEMSHEDLFLMRQRKTSAI